MSQMRQWRGPAMLLFTAALSLAIAWGATAPTARAADPDPLFVFMPKPPPLPPILPPPVGVLEGPCGVGVSPLGPFFVSDYYHHAIDVYDQNADYNAQGVTGATGFLGQLPGIDPADGPCAMAFGATNFYVNDYHRSVLRYTHIFEPPTTLVGPTANGAHNPTGVATDPAAERVYVDQRKYVSVFDESGAPVIDESDPLHPKPLQIGTDSLQDGYGLAFSEYAATQGYLYVPDAATNMIKVYDSATPQAGPIEEIDGSETPKGEFVSLRDASIAVDRVTGEIYVIDDLQPAFTERPQAIVYVFDADGTYEGHLKFLVTWGMPSGLAVDNTETPTQGRVYVTSGNSIFGSIYAYGPGSATTEPIKLPGTAPPAGESSAAAGGTGSPCPACEKEAALAAGTAPSASAPAPSVFAPAPAARNSARHHARRRHHHRRHRRRAHHRASSAAQRR